jgi:tyrosyl-tRNA synthetase
MSKDEIIKRLIKNSAEIITEEELRALLSSEKEINHYIGFEISGYVHLGTGLMTALVLKDLTDLGVKCTIWLADWHTWINEKLDGSKETAAAIGEGYFAEAMKASFMAVGGDPEKLEIRLASKWYAKQPMEFWEYVIKVSQNTSLSRMLRSVNIMGREAGDNIEHAKTMYPSMQVADIFFQGIEIAHAGMDQRKAHVVMRDVADKVAPGKPKPVVLHHPLLIGLQKPQTWPIPEGKEQKDVIMEMKMSKSDPRSAIWVHDNPEEIEQKIKGAFCPEKEIQYNPILNWAGHLLFWDRNEPFKIERKEEHGGNVEFDTYEDLEAAYASGEVHPMDLKATVANELIELLKPARDHFTKPEIAAKKAELDKLLTNK